MLEYGNGVGQVAGRAGGGNPGQSTDVGATLGQLVTDSAHTLSVMPPGTLLAGFVIVVIGFMLLKRAF